MKLFTSIPPRKDGTVQLSHDGVQYDFTGSPLCCEVEDAAHARHLKLLGFMEQDEFEAEQKFLRLQAERAARQLAPAPLDDDADGADFDAAPIEDGTPPTGRVRRVARNS